MMKSTHLQMSYEKTLFPVIFLTKKRYCGISHDDRANFNQPIMLIKGLQMKKRGNAPVLAKMS
jgi:DNA polymerase elongation subunit (family B)